MSIITPQSKNYIGNDGTIQLQDIIDDKFYRNSHKLVLPFVKGDGNCSFNTMEYFLNYFEMINQDREYTKIKPPFNINEFIRYISIIISSEEIIEGFPNYIFDSENPEFEIIFIIFSVLFDCTIKLYIVDEDVNGIMTFAPDKIFSPRTFRDFIDNHAKFDKIKKYIRKQFHVLSSFYGFSNLDNIKDKELHVLHLRGHLYPIIFDDKLHQEYLHVIELEKTDRKFVESTFVNNCENDYQIALSLQKSINK